MSTKSALKRSFYEARKSLARSKGVKNTIAYVNETRNNDDSKHKTFSKAHAEFKTILQQHLATQIENDSSTQKSLRKSPFSTHDRKVAPNSGKVTRYTPSERLSNHRNK